jgi:carbon monoxide dehydrogenase subunit G
MQLENSFEVLASPDAVWSLLNDVPQIVPCMPGTELTETVDADAWKATMHVKLGPIALRFLVDLRRDQADAAARRTLLRADARELKGRGGARATIESSLHEANGGTRVSIVTDLSLQGPVAQYGRGVVGQVAEQLTREFAECLARQLERPARGEGADPAPRPVSGVRLLWLALRRRLGLRRPRQEKTW